MGLMEINSIVSKFKILSFVYKNHWHQSSFQAQVSGFHIIIICINNNNYIYLCNFAFKLCQKLQKVNLTCGNLEQMQVDRGIWPCIRHVRALRYQCRPLLWHNIERKLNTIKPSQISLFNLLHTHQPNFLEDLIYFINDIKRKNLFVCLSDFKNSYCT